jgi:putative transposase
MSRFRLYPTRAQEHTMLGHCAQARHAWNLAWEVNSTYRKGGARTTRPVRYVGMAAMLSEVRRTDASDLTPAEADYFAWVASGNAEVQQQALRDFDQALANFLSGSHGYPQRRKKYRHEGFRVIGTGRVPACGPDGEPVLNAKGKQVMSRVVRVEKLNKKWARVKIPGCGVGEVPQHPLCPARGEDVPGHLQGRAVARRLRRAPRPDRSSGYG